MTEILIVKCLSDNYAYIYSNKNGDAFVVDPSEAGPVIDVLNKHKLNLKFILNTHHHFDHVGGNFELKEKYGCKIVGSKKDFERIPWYSLKIFFAANYFASILFFEFKISSYMIKMMMCIKYEF